jgi:hypothetical protein
MTHFTIMQITMDMVSTFATVVMLVSMLIAITPIMVGSCDRIVLVLVEHKNKIFDFWYS